MTPLLLSIEERRSPLWRKIAEHYEEKLQVLRQQNDGDRSEAETSKLRGRIAEVKLMLALGNDPQRTKLDPLESGSGF